MSQARPEQRNLTIILISIRKRVVFAEEDAGKGVCGIGFKGMPDKFKAVWNDLNRSIYVGERREQNLKALTAVSIFTALLGLVLIIMDLTSDLKSMLIPALVTFLGGVSCAYIAGVQKDREKAILIPTVFCAVAFTYYALTAAAKGTAILWSLLLPIGISYFVSVKYGIILSFYYTVLYAILFYTPLKARMAVWYTPDFLTRFPILYASLSIFTAIAMIHYHRSSLLEIDYTDRLNEEVARQTAVAEERSRKIEQMSFQTIQALANAIDAKDPYTRGHSTRVSLYSARIAEKLGWSKEKISDLRYAAMLHDIGKIGVPDSILNKPRRLSDVEFDIIKSHTTMGAEILKEKVMIETAENVALSHHERYDGSGYPQGLRGTEISEEARIVAIADAFDAMNSNRIYRKACDRKRIRNEMENGAGTQFDPELVRIFIDLWDRGLLDEIAKDEHKEQNRGDLETSSVLLQEVMKAFTTQVTMDGIDIITGVMSRSAGESAIAQAMKEESGCFVFFDVDNLKKINDTHGHNAGDKVLKLMGECLIKNGDGCLSCRLGGDEFLFFIKNCSKEESESRVQKIIHEFDEKKNRDPEIGSASLSAGMVMCTPEDTYNKAYSMADKALYHVKQNGKNGSCFYDKDSESRLNDRADINKLVDVIRKNGNYDGALDVEYRQFSNLYDFIENLEKRFDHPFKLVMITLEENPGELFHEDELEKAMYFMEQSIRQTIRNVDVITRYNRRQFLIILVGTDEEGVKTAMARIFRGYYKMNGSSTFTPSFDISS